MNDRFTAADVPDQSGKTFLITGANTGLGLEIARVLARQGARVLLGCRSMSKAEAAVAALRSELPDADLDIVSIDLGDLASVRAAAERVAQEPRLDGLINNAGIMMPPRELTKDGFESQFGVNHLGTFALTGLLLPKLQETPGSRIVNTASNAHKTGKMDLDDVNAEQSYSALGRYCMSKLANLLHVFELNRRLQARNSTTLAVTAHPGFSDTELARHLPGWMTMFIPAMRLMMNTAAQGAWPTLMAATDPDVEGGQYFGPRGLGELAGPARRVESKPLSKDPVLAKGLWDRSVEMTGVDPEL